MPVYGKGNQADIHGNSTKHPSTCIWNKHINTNYSSKHALEHICVKNSWSTIFMNYYFHACWTIHAWRQLTTLKTTQRNLKIHSRIYDGISILLKRIWTSSKHPARLCYYTIAKRYAKIQKIISKTDFISPRS